MATCSYCKQEMTEGVSCIEEDITLIDGDYQPIPYGRETRRSNDPDMQARLDAMTHCHDCQTPKDGYHHPGCDAEECPRCRGQIISCNCHVSEPELAADALSA